MILGRVYRLLLRLHPRSFREEYGAELLETMAAREAERASLPPGRRWSGRAREIAALVRSAMELSRRERRQRKSSERWTSLRPLLADLKLALRGFRLNPGFTTVVVVTLSLGIGANSAIFTLMDQVLLRQLPVHEPEELVSLAAPGSWSGWVLGRARFSHPAYRELLAENDAFAGVLARYADSVTIEHGGRSQRARAVLVSGNYFDLLGVAPFRGRLLTPNDDSNPGGHPVAVLSHRYWSARFGSSDAVLGDTLVVNGRPLQVVGVAAEGFNGVSVGEAPDLFVPLMMKAAMTPTWDELDNRKTAFLNLVARLAPSLSLQQASASANATYANIRERDLAVMSGGSEAFQQRFRQRRLELHPAARGISALREQFSTPLIVLMGMVGLVLLVACANVANLLLARSVARQKEVALKLALGASRARLIRQLLVETCLLAGIGGALGLLVSSWTSDVLLRALPFEGAALTFSSTPDPRVLGFTFTLSTLTGLLFGLFPALQATSRSQASTLRQESLAASIPQARFRKLLVVAQIALSLLLLVGAGLFGRSLYNLTQLDPGFRSERLTSFSVDPSLNGYDLTRMRALFVELRRELLSRPEVASVSMAQLASLSDNAWRSTVRVEGYEAAEGEDMNPDVNGVGPDYFRTLGIPLLAGREFTERDIAGRPRVAVVNQAMARYFFGDESPIGKRFGFGRSAPELDIEIVGLVADGKYQSLREELPRFVYLPYAQEPTLSTMTFYLRARGDAAPTVETIRQAVRGLDPALPVYGVKSMDERVADSMFVERLVAGLSGAFGLVASLLAAIGLYGVMSFTVTRRTREIGIRMALGARRESVVHLVLREVALLALVGVVVGMPLGVGLGRIVSSQLFGLSPWDPLTWIGASLALLAVAFASGYVPARRASRLDPTLALRWE